jgi:hypothetical protein
VSEQATHRITLFSMPDKTLLRQFGSYGTIAGRLCEPRGVRIARDNRHLLVAERGGHRVSMFTFKGRFVRHVGVDVLRCPVDVEVDAVAGGIVVPDCEHDRVCRFNKDGRFVGAWGASGAVDGSLSRPASAVFVGGRLFVQDSASPRCHVFV